MIHAYFDDDPTSSAHWAASLSAPTGRILIQISDRVGSQVRLPLEAAEASTFAAALALLVEAAAGTSIRSRGLASASERSRHWAAYASDGKVRVEICHDDLSVGVEMPTCAAIGFERNVRSRVAELRATGRP